jgi:hypothetical protein
MKARSLALGTGLIALVTFLYVQPLLTTRVLAGSLRNSEIQSVRERMDAESVREGLRREFSERQRAAGRIPNPSAARIASLTLFGKGIEMLIAMAAPETSAQDEDGPAEITDWGYDSASRFHVALEQEASAPLTLVLHRRGLSWQVMAMKPSEAAWRESERVLVRDAVE